jgi:DNA segregation ATPase FtsK/SpoIIIE-like protein
MFTIIAAQNPTKENLGRLDLGSVDARMAFHCPKEVNSRTILDEGGAENLWEQGLALVKLPRNGGMIQKIKGSLIEADEISKVIDEIYSRHGDSVYYGFALDKTKLITADTQSENVVFTTATVQNEKELAEKMFADIIIWALGRKVASGNAIVTTFEEVYGLKEKAGRKLIEELYKIGIVSKQDEVKPRNPRTVIPSNIGELTEEAISFLERHGYCEEDIGNAFNSRN